MKERIVEILIYIMSELRGSTAMGEIDLRDLRNKGYTQSEINAALSWLSDTMQTGENGASKISRPSAGSKRILHETERNVITTEGYGYLIQLRELGLLDDAGLETIIERAMMSGYESVTLNELQELVASVLFAPSPGGRGGRSMLDSRDTVN